MKLNEAVYAGAETQTFESCQFATAEELEAVATVLYLVLYFIFDAAAQQQWIIGAFQV